MWLLQLQGVFKGSATAPGVDFKELLAHFDAVQAMHNDAKATGRMSRKSRNPAPS